MTAFCPSIPILNSLQNRVFGCSAFVHVHSPYQGKLDLCAIKCVFIDYAPNKKGYKCYHPQSRKVYISKDVTFHETESFFPNSQLQGESIQEAEDLELPPFPLLHDFVLRENDKDPMPTSLLEKNNENKYFGKQYERRQQEPVLIEQQLQLSKPGVKTHTYDTFEDTLNETNLDDLPIALRKEKRSRAKYPISQFVSTEKLSMQHRSCLLYTSPSPRD